ncbi:MAG TPA: pyrroline-5-carboxylate reductase, partial [Anaerolineae bacterium]|nr:pyrroline-5-carboxylate reductase [Anaerolineae bacterium]
MLQESRISFIGSGTMAEAMIKGILSHNLIAPERITASGPRPERGQELHERYGVVGTTDNQAAADIGEIVVFSVKPQILPDVLQELRGHISRNALILSIVAGARIDTILDVLGHPAIVRAMPNTPAQVGKGMTVWTCTEEVDEKQQGQARSILGALGEELFVEDEDYLDMATALSGTG